MILAVCSLAAHQLGSTDDGDSGEAQLLAAVLSGLVSSSESSSRGIEAVGDIIVSGGGDGDGIITKEGVGLHPAAIPSSRVLRCEVWLTAPCLVPLVARSLESLMFARESVDLGG